MRQGCIAYKRLLLMQLRLRRSIYMGLRSPGSAQRAGALAILSCVFVSVAVLAAPEQTPGAVAEIQAVLRAQQDAWNRGNINGFMDGYARSPSTVFVSEDEVRRGWETVRERYHEKYSDRAKMGRLTFSDIEITPLSSDAAVVLGRWRLDRANDHPHGRFTLIFKRLPEGWRIVHDHTSAAPPAK